MSAVIARRDWLFGLGASCATFLGQRPAEAGAAVPISLERLVQTSELAFVATAREAVGTWELTETGKRIVTYSRVEVHQALDGRPAPDGELTVRTLGGRVGDIGQVVHGEAELEVDKPAVFFVRPAVSGSFALTAMAQGHYALGEDERGVFRLSPSPKLADFIRRDPSSAVSRLRGKSVADCERLVLEALNTNE